MLGFFFFFLLSFCRAESNYPIYKRTLLFGLGINVTPQECGMTSEEEPKMVPSPPLIFNNQVQVTLINNFSFFVPGMYCTNSSSISTIIRKCDSNSKKVISVCGTSLTLSLSLSFLQTLARKLLYVTNFWGSLWPLRFSWRNVYPSRSKPMSQSLFFIFLIRNLPETPFNLQYCK